ncbi:SLOG family protein [Macrococcus equi]|uniref:SLOG family protein n=1 Tax=Macrococcus equi TaxID=3395462 RepID=UPI0039BE63ED
MKTVYITGYKPYEIGIFKNNQPEVRFIKLYLQDKIKSYIKEGLEWVIIQGNLGTELWAGEIVIRLKKQYDIKLGIITPFLNHTEKWNEENQLYYQRIAQRADYLNSVFQDTYKGSYMFQQANQFILDNTEGTILFYDEELEASPQYFKRTLIDFMEKNHYTMDSISLFDLSEFVSEYMREQEN